MTVLNKLYSSFSQTKGLLWHQYFDGIIRCDFMPPVGAVIDLTDVCNLKCEWCNSQHFRGQRFLETKHVCDVLKDLKLWGTKSVCFAGGGEPTLHKDFGLIVEQSHKLGLEVGISTNGTLMSPEQAQIVANHARFCGFSVDAAQIKTWCSIKKGPNSLWHKLLNNAECLGKFADKTSLDFSFKFMVVPANQYEISKACILAKKLHFKTFFVRPAAFQNIPRLEKLNLRFDVASIKEQLEQCKSLETDRFKVYGSFGRVDDKLGRVIRFSKCRATPLLAVYCADGWCYLCIDMRERIYARMCRHLELPLFWNSEEHHEMIENINLNRCPRCAFGHYNEQIEAYAQDFMYRWFP